MEEVAVRILVVQDSARGEHRPGERRKLAERGRVQSACPGPGLDLVGQPDEALVPVAERRQDRLGVRDRAQCDGLRLAQLSTAGDGLARIEETGEDHDEVDGEAVRLQSQPWHPGTAHLAQPSGVRQRGRDPGVDAGQVGRAGHGRDQVQVGAVQLAAQSP